MPMKTHQFPNFYMGAAAESIFSGEMFLFGYEAAKFNPDFGVDFQVTNAARQKFYSETERSIQVQVKSTLAYKGMANVFVDEDDFSYLCKSPTRFLVVYVFHDFFKPVDMDSANCRADLVDQAVQRDISKYEASMMDQHGAEIKRNDPSVIFEFRCRKRSVFWLNGSQLRNGISSGDWKKNSNGTFSARVQIDDCDIALNEKQLFPELSELLYLMSPPHSQYSFETGKYSYEHI